MYEPPILRCTTNLISSVPENHLNAKLNPGANVQLDFQNKLMTSWPCKPEGKYLTGKAGRQNSCKGYNSDSSCIIRLEEDVQRLQQLLHEEMEFHLVLENALEHAAVSISDSSCLPSDAQELLSNIATLEISVSRLEEEMISLHFQLIQERNERRLAEYRHKQLSSQLSQICQAENTNNDRIDGKLMQDENMPKELSRHVASQRLKRQISVKGLWNHPNQLSEEILRCMKHIFISLADASSSSNGSSSEFKFPVSSSTNISSSSKPGTVKPSTISSWADSPQVGPQRPNDILSTGTTFDPYKFHGKLCWADIGNYSLATEVSWMSVGKKQLEYAAGALRRFRSLIEQLAEVNPVHLNDNEKLAFWINLYNALIMHAYLAYGVPGNDIKLFTLMQKAAYTVAGHSLSAASIEYGILKMKPPAHRPQKAILLALQKFKLSDEQRKFSVESSEPLVAFALSCGSYSSPAVKIYTPANVKEELQEAQHDFIRASVGVGAKGKLLVPKMLHCFTRGLVDDSNLLSWISRFLPQQQAAFAQQCMAQRRHNFLVSRSFSLVPFDSRFRYLILPEKLH